MHSRAVAPGGLGGKGLAPPPFPLKFFSSRKSCKYLLYSLGKPLDSY